MFREQTRLHLDHAIKNAEFEGRQEYRTNRARLREEAARSPLQRCEHRRTEVAQSIQNMRAVSPLRGPIDFAKAYAQSVR